MSADSQPQVSCTAESSSWEGVGQLQSDKIHLEAQCEVEVLHSDRTHGLLERAK